MAKVTTKTKLYSTCVSFASSDDVEVNSQVIILSKDVPANIEFKDVNFSYNKIKYILNGFSIKIQAGSTIGVIGGTGSGKSTLVNLLPRFYDVSSGEILTVTGYAPAVLIFGCNTIFFLSISKPSSESLSATSLLVTLPKNLPVAPLLT